MQSDVILLSFPPKEEETSTRMQLRFQRKRQRETPTPTPAPTISITNTSHKSLSITMLRLGDFHVPTIVNYSTLLTFGLMLWILYLILPRGFRQFMCNAHPRRYKRSSPNRVIRILGKSTPSPQEILQRKGLTLSRSVSTENSNSSSVNSTLYRGNQKFSAVKRGSPLKSSSFSQDRHQSVAIQGRVDSGVMSQRRNLAKAYSSDISSLTPAQNSNGSFSDRNTYAQTNSGDLSIATNDNENSETMSSTGHAIWGTPKRFVRKRILDEGPGQGQYLDVSMGRQTVTDDDTNVESLESLSSDIKGQNEEQRTSLSEVGSLASTFSSGQHSSSTSGILRQSSGSVSESVAEPSPIHPDATCGHNVPSEIVLSSTLLSFRDPGIRLYAHGTQCEPRRIWIRLDVMNEQLSWRTENTAASNRSSNDPNLVTLGQVHQIPLMQVLFVDVGRTTAALQMLDIHEDSCFSILTNGGSLDLQASNKLERDALISCMCLILDTVYNNIPREKSWRRLNDVAGSVGSSSLSSMSGSRKDNGNNFVSVAPESQSPESSESGGVDDVLPYSSSSSESNATGSMFGSDVFHGIDLGSQVSATFGEI
jgi:hypothetical protein